MYKKLIEYHVAGKVSFKYVKTFNMDEYVGEFVYDGVANSLSASP
jgi:6-phosphogluconolactonase/glucosamine-6-phosphate isomerase/deaminase